MPIAATTSGVTAAAIRAGTLKDSSLIAKRFFDVGSNLWASPTYLKQFGGLKHSRNLAKASFVGFKGFNRLRLANGKSEAEVPMVGRIVADDLEAIKALAVLGEGIAWLPDFLAADAVAAGTLVSVLPNWKSKAMGNIYFVYAGRQASSTPKIAKLASFAARGGNRVGHRTVVSDVQ